MVLASLDHVSMGVTQHDLHQYPRHIGHHVFGWMDLFVPGIQRKLHRAQNPLRIGASQNVTARFYCLAPFGHIPHGHICHVEDAAFLLHRAAVAEHEVVDQKFLRTEAWGKNEYLHAM
jgi:hypothetical protein